jgi:hypothetical protein
MARLFHADSHPVGVKRPRWVRGQERTFPASAGMSSGGVAFAIASEQIRQALVGSLQVMQ